MIWTKIPILISVTLASSVVLFQNCSNQFQSVDQRSEEKPLSLDDCELPWGEFLNSGGVVVGYRQASVPYGQNCESEALSCNDGTLSSQDYRFHSCVMEEAGSCALPWGGSIAHGQNVTAYQNGNVAFGQSCSQQTRTCNNGTLSGTYGNQNCTVGTAANCTLPWGGVLAHAQSVTAYQSGSVAFGQSCTQQTRTCNNGALSGTYSNQNCSTVPANGCTLPWGGSIAHGQNVTAYQNGSVAFGQSCTQQTRTCNNGTLSGTYRNQNCTISPAANCTLPWGGNLTHGQSVTAYQSGSVAFGQSCVQQTRACNNGTLSGTYSNQNCTVSPAANCTLPWGGNLPHGENVTAYRNSSVPRGQECESQTRSCSNGNLSGAFVNRACGIVNRPFQDLGIGFNLPYLIPDAVADNRYSAEERTLRREMNKRSIRNAYKIGANHIVVFLGSAYPGSQHDYDTGKNQYLLWQQNPTAYWDRVEEIFNYVHANNLKVIARGWADQRVFPTLVSNIAGNSPETMRDFITRANSKSYLMYKAYWTQFLTRFKDKPYMLAVGSINELNLFADLDRVKRCQDEQLSKTPPPSTAEIQKRCSSMGNFTTDELIAFNQRVVNDIFKAVAPQLPTISGMGIPRESAENLRAHPEFSGNSGISMWCKDSRAQFEKNLREINAAFDYVDLHTYNQGNGNGIVRFTGESRPSCPQVAADPRGRDEPGDASFISYVNSYVRSLGKKMYIGEFGDSWEAPKDGHDQFNHTKNIVQLLGTNGFNSASIWSLEFYQMTTHDMQRMNLDYNNTKANELFQTIANKGAGPLLYEKNLSVLISSPIKDRRYNRTFAINALIDSTSSAISSVKIYIDNNLVRTLQSWPYKHSINPADYSKGIKTIKVIVEDSSGNKAESSVPVEFY